MRRRLFTVVFLVRGLVTIIFIKQKQAKSEALFLNSPLLVHAVNQAAFLAPILPRTDNEAHDN